MSKNNIINVPGVCAGHPEHPELLWVFTILPSGKLKYDHIEIDFPEESSNDPFLFRKFDVDMSGFEHCPYCESELYFFCKRCRTLSCFSWDQVSDSQRWTCHSCNSVYRMKPKKTPFRVEAQADPHKHHQNNSTNTHHTSHNTTSSSTKSSGHSTQYWHPKSK